MRLSRRLRKKRGNGTTSHDQTMSNSPDDNAVVSLPISRTSPARPFSSSRVRVAFTEVGDRAIAVSTAPARARFRMKAHAATHLEHAVSGELRQSHHLGKRIGRFLKQPCRLQKAPIDVVEPRQRVGYQRRFPAPVVTHGLRGPPALLAALDRAAIKNARACAYPNIPCAHSLPTGMDSTVTAMLRASSGCR
jgi:hypothetical protein